jgi:hypothetical protein
VPILRPNGCIRLQIYLWLPLIELFSCIRRRYSAMPSSRPQPDDDPRAVQSFDHCNGTVAPWITAAAEQESSYLEPAVYALQTPDAQIGDAELGATPHTANQTLVQTVETAEPTSNNNNGNNVVCFGTVSRTLTSLNFFGVDVMAISTDLRR